MSKLAIDGGRPIRAEPLPFARADIGADEIEAAVRVLRSGWLTTGPETRAFEEEFAAYTGLSRALAVSSATAALHLAIQVAGVGAGDEVIVPTMTFTSSAAVVMHAGARPVLADVLEADGTLSPDEVERLAGPRTRAIIAVDLGGQPAHYEALRELTDAKGLVLIDDAAHAIPSMHRGRTIGAVADLSAFSFYATKPLTTGEGGMLVALQDDHLERARSLALHGLSHDAWRRYESGGSWRYDVVSPGYKYNLPDLLAAIGRVQLRRARELYERRVRIAQTYTEAFRGFDAIETPIPREGDEHSWHLFTIRLRLDYLSRDRDYFISALRAEGIGCSVHFIPLHRFTLYREAIGPNNSDFPVADALFDRIVSLPIYPSMSERDIRDVAEGTTKVLRSLMR